MFLFIAAAQSKRIPHSNYEPIRITMDYDYLNGTKYDPGLCTKFGFREKTTWEYEETCWAFMSDYAGLAPYVIGTFENARKYVQRLVKVQPRVRDVYTKKNVMTTPNEFIGGSSFLAAPFDKEPQIPNTDLYIAVVFRPLHSQDYPTTLGYITSIDEREYTGRPLTGMIVASMSPHKYKGDDLKLRIEDENTPNNFVFWSVVKNIIQILGFEKNQYTHYHPFGSTERYDNPTCLITLKKSDDTIIRRYKFLITPNARKFAKRHFGVDTFTFNGQTCPAGIELQDGEASDYGLLEGRTLFADVMSGGIRNYIYPRITDATAAVLLDTGNYELNWSMVQPHEWGHKESIDENYIPNFATGNPQYVYPRYYMLNSSTSDAEKEKVTGFNFKFVGSMGDWEADPSGTKDRTRYKYNKDYFNPLGWRVASKWPTADFAVIKAVNRYCPPYTAILPSEDGPYDFRNDGLYFATRSKAYKVYQCGEYDCRTYNEFKYRLYNNSQRTQYVDIICNNDNANVKFTHTVDGTTYTMWCPEPERFCRSMNLNHAYFKSNPFDNENTDQEDALPLPTTIPPTVAPSPEPTLEPTPDPTPSAWPTERPPELWTDQPEEWFIPKKTRTPVPPETPEPTEHPEQTDYPTHYRTPDQTEFVLPTVGIASDVIASAVAAAKAGNVNGNGVASYDGSTTIIVIGVIAIIVIIDIAVILNVFFIFKKGKNTDIIDDAALSEAEFNV